MPLLNKINFKDENELISYLGNLIDKHTHINYAANVEQAVEMGEYGSRQRRWSFACIFDSQRFQ